MKAVALVSSLVILGVSSSAFAWTACDTRKMTAETYAECVVIENAGGEWDESWNDRSVASAESAAAPVEGMQPRADGKLAKRQ